MKHSIRALLIVIAAGGCGPPEAPPPPTATPTDYQVYAALFAGRTSLRPIFVADRTFALDTSMRRFLREGDYQPETRSRAAARAVRRLLADSAEPAVVERPVAPGNAVRMVPADSVTRIFARVSRQPGDLPGGLVAARLSRVFYARGTTAAVFLEEVCGNPCGGAEIVVLRRTRTGWVRDYDAIEIAY